MVGQCIFCSWYGIRLRRASELARGQQMYHPHCVRVALESPDPTDRGLAERILRMELPRLLRDRFWEHNPPNLTLRSGQPVQEITADDFHQVCEKESLGEGGALRNILSDRVRLPEPEQAQPATCWSPPNSHGETLDAESTVANRLVVAPALPAPAAPRKRKPRPPRSNVDRAMELVTRLSPAEIDELRGRLSGLSALAAAA